MPPKKVIKADPKKAGAKNQQAAVPAKKASQQKRTAKNSELEEPEPSEAEEALRSPPRKSPPRRNLEKSTHESPAPSAPSPGSAASRGSTNEAGILAQRRTNALQVQFDAPQGNSLAALEQGLVLLRRSSKLCDVTIISSSGQIPAHRVVLAAHSEKLATRFQDQSSELDLRPASHEAVDAVVRWLYCEVNSANFNPTTPKVNEEILRISSELGLPRLADLCAMRLAESVDTSSAVSAVRLCEEYALPTLRAAIVEAIVSDARALKEVSIDASTLTHPVLMRELLAAIATQAASG